MALERLRQHEEAAADYSAVLQLDPLNAPAWQNRGTLWLRLGRLHEAVHDLGRAVALDGCAAAAWHARGEAHERLGQGDAALADLQRWGQLWAGCSGRCRAGVPTRWKSRCHQRAKVFFVFFFKTPKGPRVLALALVAECSEKACFALHQVLPSLPPGVRLQGLLAGAVQPNLPAQPGPGAAQLRAARAGGVRAQPAAGGAAG